MTLAIEASTARVQPTTHQLETFRARIRPPREWVPWLERARSGGGLLGDHIPWRMLGMKDPERIERAHQVMARASRTSTVFIGRLERPLELHPGGLEDRPHGRVCLTEEQLFGGPSLRRDYGEEAPCFWLDVLGPARLEADGVGLEASEETLRKRYPEWFREGAVVLVAPGAIVERSHRAQAVPLPAGALERAPGVFWTRDPGSRSP